MNHGEGGMDAADTPAAWAIVELMGHVRLAGRLSEEEHYGAKMGRLDIPTDGWAFVTQFFGGGSVYRITLVSEDVARHVAKAARPEPVSPWDFPKQLSRALPGMGDDDHDEDANDEDDDGPPV